MLFFLPGREEGEDPIDGATWDKGSLLEAELVERRVLDHFLPEKQYCGYSRGLLSLLAHRCLLADSLLGILRGRFVAVLFTGGTRAAAQSGREWGVYPPRAAPV